MITKFGWLFAKLVSKIYLLMLHEAISNFQINEISFWAEKLLSTNDPYIFDRSFEMSIMGLEITKYDTLI